MFLKADGVALSPTQAMFVAPKRSFKKSPDRNTLKRRMRESYRLQKQELYDTLAENKQSVLLAFIYTGKKEEEFPQIFSSIQSLLRKLLAKNKP
jgi:ribonuclease P protein component